MPTMIQPGASANARMALRCTGCGALFVLEGADVYPGQNYVLQRGPSGPTALFQVPCLDVACDVVMEIDAPTWARYMGEGGDPEAIVAIREIEEGRAVEEGAEGAEEPARGGPTPPLPPSAAPAPPVRPLPPGCKPHPRATGRTHPQSAPLGFESDQKSSAG